MRIFITGINGFVGASMANYFAAKGYGVEGMGRQENIAKYVNASCRYIRADIRHTLEPIEADVVIHSAALATDAAAYEDFYSNNVVGTKNVLDACKNVKIFIQISTSSVYAFSAMPMKEEEAGKSFEALSNYGKTKYLAEQLVKANTTISQKYILRPRAIYGKLDRIILRKLLKLKKGNMILIPEHITTQTSLTQIDNLVEAAALCLKLKEANNSTHVFNIADDEVYHLGTAIQKLLSAVAFQQLKMLKVSKLIWNLLVVINEKMKFNRSLTKFGSNEITKIAMLDTTAAKENLSYAPKRNMDNSLQEIVDWIEGIGGWKKYREG